MKTEYFLGVDVSKGYADFVILNEQLIEVEPCFQLDDTVQGRQTLEVVIKKYFDKVSDLVLFCGFESTGGYERNWHVHLLTLLSKYDLKIIRVNPVAVKGISKASLNRSITDATSAINIAIYLASYKTKLDFSNKSIESTFQNERSIYTFYKMLVKQQTQLKNQLEKLLYQSNSELLVYCRRGIPGWLLRVLEKHPSIESIKKAGATKLIKINGVSADRAHGLLQKLEANKSTGHRETGYVIQQTVSEILHKQERINTVENRLVEQYGNQEMVKLLSTIVGIGIPTAILLMFEIEDINRFQTVKQMAAYFGVNPEFRESGDGTMGKHMSKKGRKALRAALYMSGLTALRWDASLKQLYSKYRKEGKNHYFAMGVLMHKLLRIIYGVLKSGITYNPTIDQQNRERSIEKQERIQELKKQQILNNREKKRRYLNEDNKTAPISNRKSSKIKELETSLSTKSAMVQDHPQLLQK